MKLNKTLFYILSFTWGLPMTLLGAVVTLVLMALGYKPQRYGSCVYVKVGKIWGGFSLGLFLITDRIAGASTLSHEHGHAVQNCIFGPLMPFVIGIPSALRYWFRKINTRLGHKNKRPYYDIWFEKQATKWGKKYVNRYYMLLDMRETITNKDTITKSDRDIIAEVRDAILKDIPIVTIGDSTDMSAIENDEKVKKLMEDKKDDNSEN